MSIEVEVLTPHLAAALLRQPYHGSVRQPAAVAAYRLAMIEGGWMLNGMPIVVSRTGVVLDGVQRLHACVESGLPLTTFVARDVDDRVLHTIDQHRRRSFATVLASRGIPHAHAQAALMIRLVRYDDRSLLREGEPAPSWGRMERVLRANPDLEDTVAASLGMAGSPLPEPVRTAILYMGRQVDRAATLRLLEAVRHPERFDLGEPGVLLRTEMDRLHEGSPVPRGRTRLLALSILALNALLRRERPRRLVWGESPAGGPAEAFPLLDGYSGLADPGPRHGPPETAGAVRAGGPPTARIETIDQDAARRYLALGGGQRALVKAHVDSLARDIATGRWMANAQPICFSRAGRLINGRHRLMAVVAARGTIEVPVVSGLADEVAPTYDTHPKRAPSVEDALGTFGDTALAAAMANLFWRSEGGGAATRARRATAAELRQILVRHPRLLELRSFGRRMTAYGRASVMGYGAYVVERDDPGRAPLFLRALETGADLAEGQPVLDLRGRMQRLRGDRAPQEEQLAALLDGWERFKAHEAGRTSTARPPPPAARREPPDGIVDGVGTPAGRPRRGRHVRDPANPGDPPRPDATAERCRSSRQQELLAAFGRFVLRDVDPLALMQEAARIAADGVSVPLSKVLRHEPESGVLVVRGDIGWREGIVGTVGFPPDASSPAGYLFSTGLATLRHRHTGDPRFDLPDLFARSGVRHGLDVLIRGDGAPFGVLAVDDTADGTFSAGDVTFLQALAGTLGLALAHGRSNARLKELLAERDRWLAEVRHGVADSLRLVRTVLTLQAEAAEDGAARDVLHAGALRVATIATVHERAHQTGNPEAVEMRGYLLGLTGAMRDDVGGLTPGSAIAIEAAPGTYWPARRAQVLGLVLSELVAIALRHGRGDVRVRFEPALPTARLEVLHEGSAASPDGTLTRSEQLGIGIVQALLRQHGGTLTVATDGAGEHFIVELPQPGPDR